MSIFRKVIGNGCDPPLQNPGLPFLIHSLQYQAILNYKLKPVAGDIQKPSGMKKEYVKIT